MKPRCGTVALFGWTNVGKSTLLNRLVGDKVAAVADVAQTTRRRITGVISVPGRGQIVLVDTPGLHRPRDAMNRAMIEQIHQSVFDVDIAILLVDGERGLGPGDRQAAALLRRGDGRRLLVLNKSDRVRPKSKLLPMIQTGVEEWGFDEVLPLSALTGDGCDRLIDRVFALLPESEPLYPDDYLTDQTERELAEEWIREKLLRMTREELPHALAVCIDRWHEREDGLVEIEAEILVDKASQKPIVIGRAGSVLKEVGTQARLELEELLGRKVFIQFWVKVRDDWRNDERTLRRLGLH